MAERRTSSKGRHRRTVLIETAADLLMEQGFAAVSHRSVAAKAELPLAATTYYFSSLSDLVQAALDQLAANWSAHAHAAVQALPMRIADTGLAAAAVVEVVAFAPVGAGTAEPADVLVVYERYLEAARNTHLRETIGAYDRQLDGLVGQVLHRAGLPDDEECARLVLAVTDGALLRCLAEGAELSTAQAVVQRLLEQLGDDPA